MLTGHVSISNGPRHAKTRLRAYTESEGPDQPAPPRSRMYGWRAKARVKLRMNRMI